MTTARIIELLTAGLANAAFAAYLWLGYRGQRIHRLLAMMLLGECAYSVFCVGLAAAPDLQAAETWVRYSVALPYTFIFSLYGFALAFGRLERSRALRSLRVAAALAALVDVLGRAFGLIPVRLAYQEGQGWYPSQDLAYRTLYAPAMLSMVGVSLAVFWWRWRRPASTLQGNQAGYLWLSIALGMAFSSFNLVPRWRILGALGPVLSGLVLIYALTRRRLLDLQPVFREGLANAVMLALLLLFLGLGVFYERPGDGGWGLASMVLLFAVAHQPMYRWLVRVLRVRRGESDVPPGTELLGYSLLMDSHPTLKGQLEATLRQAAALHRLQGAAILLPASHGRFTLFAQWPGPADRAGLEIDADGVVARRLRDLPEGMTPDSLGWTRIYELPGSPTEPPDSCHAFLRAARAQACFALVTRQRMLGVLVLGHHAEGRPLRMEELALFQALAGQLAVTVENAALSGRIQEVDRLSALGTLAASLAHELRNPLASVSMFVQMLPQRHADPGFLERFQRVVPAELAKLTGMTEQLLTLARPATRAPHVVDLGALCLRLHRLVAHPFAKRQVGLAFDTPEGLLVDGTEEELSQVLLSLLLGSLEASPQGSQVRLALVQISGTASLTIEDRRGAMSAPRLEEIFEPVFTAGEGRSAVLGLASSRRVAEALGGRLWAESRQDGVRLHLELPVAKTVKWPSVGAESRSVVGQENPFVA